MVVRQRVALLHRSELQQWMLTPGSSSVWQCRAVAQPLVSLTPNATATRQTKVFSHAGLHRINFRGNSFEVMILMHVATELFSE